MTAHGARRTATTSDERRGVMVSWVVMSRAQPTQDERMAERMAEMYYPTDGDDEGDDE